MQLDYEIKLNEPYPQIEGAVLDQTTVGVLKNLAFSKSGELFAVLTYIFNSNIADEADADIGKLFEEIAITEMLHINLLMHAICAFGGVPKYENEFGAYFNTANVQYSTKLKDMLTNAVKDEQRAIEEYEAAKKRVKNASLIALFDRIIKDEQLHLNAFKNLLNTIHFLSI